eukprot:TRINITY_DN112439_c0_g1_i1.p1 TRINITY_DN112439_c0_g1~~TRINITY_DN112439_c0_g1_i1.p1  ORF type:complete len:249 (-),score=37.21 TRINITY_DN112439_c0_g1_i1:255-1001(-)
MPKSFRLVGLAILVRLAHKSLPLHFCKAPRASNRRSMGKVVVCRHGTSLWNLEKRWQGEQDIELAPQGHDQARQQAEDFEAAGIKFDLVVSSDLKRAFTTAEILAAKYGLSPTADSRLRECSLGIWEGEHRDEIKGPKFAHIFEKLNSMSHNERVHTAYFEGLETPADMALRARALAMEVSRNHPEKTVLLVTHSTIMEAILAVEAEKHFEGISMRNLAWFEWLLSAEGAAKIGHVDGITFSDGIGLK